MMRRAALELDEFSGMTKLTIEPDGGQLRLYLTDWGTGETLDFHLDQAEQLALIRYLLGVD